MTDVSERVQAVARALCSLDGKDPDERTRRPGEGAGFVSRQSGDDAPHAWKAYIAEAERFIAASEALQPFLERARRW